MGYDIELLQVATADGVILDGAWATPLERDEHASDLPVEAFLPVHGTGGNFYSSGVLQTFAEAALKIGVPVLRINTRGHDGMSYLRTVAPRTGGSLRGGATFESIADCPFDVLAWIDCLAARGIRRVALVGHSMGAVKSVIAMAERPHSAVVGVIAISPPRFCHANLLADERGAFREEFVRAQELCAAGSPEMLLSVTQPIPHVATARGYLEKYGPEDRYDFLKYVNRLKCPALVLVGSESAAKSAAFRNLPEVLSAMQLPPDRLTVETVAGANINYTGHEVAPFERSLAWLRSLRSSFTQLLQNGDTPQTPLQ